MKDDAVTTIGKSIIQHGKFNDRIYLMKLDKSDNPEILDSMDELALKENYSKIFSKVAEYAKKDFLEHGYTVEACIPRFFNSEEDVYFLGKYFSDDRKADSNSELDEKVLKTAISKSNESFSEKHADDFSYRICTEKDISDIVNVYKKVFETYPFPIHDPEYIKKTMDMNVIYFAFFDRDKIVSLSSAEIDPDSCNAEMTDFATLPEYRRIGLSGFLLHIMEEEMKKMNITTVYTIARACSYGINIVFSKSGYTYSGKLINNTNIAGSFENMNVWYKHLI